MKVAFVAIIIAISTSFAQGLEITELNETNFDTVALQKDVHTVIYIHSSENWCGEYFHSSHLPSFKLIIKIILYSGYYLFRKVQESLANVQISL